MPIEATQNELGAVPPPPPRRRRFQFSLLALLWLTTLVACLAALWAMYRDLRKAKSESQAAKLEVQKYRDEMGYLAISDPEKIYARGLTTMGKSDWYWRAYLPANKVFKIGIASENIPADGLPVPGICTTISPGEHLIGAVLCKRHDSDSVWTFTTEIDNNGGFGLQVPPPFSGPHDITEITRRAPQISVDPPSPLIFLRYRKWKGYKEPSKDSIGICGTGLTSHPDPSVASDPQPCKGLMLWIEEENPKPAVAKPNAQSPVSW